MATLSHAADTESISRILRINPVWHGMRTAGDAVNLPDTTLLHAGPAFSHPSKIVQPVLNSAKVALVFNGAAHDFGEAENLILSSREESRWRGQQHRAAAHLCRLGRPWVMAEPCKPRMTLLGRGV